MSRKLANGVILSITLFFAISYAVAKDLNHSYMPLILGPARPTIPGGPGTPTVTTIPVSPTPTIPASPVPTATVVATPNPLNCQPNVTTPVGGNIPANSIAEGKLAQTTQEDPYTVTINADGMFYNLGVEDLNWQGENNQFLPVMRIRYPSGEVVDNISASGWLADPSNPYTAKYAGAWQITVHVGSNSNTTRYTGCYKITFTRSQL